MGLKETLNEKPKLAIGLTAGFIACALLLAFLTGSIGGGGGSSGGNRTEQAYFTADDGKTWFPDAAGKITPFDHGGKEAVQAHVFEAGGKQFVNHLERFSVAGRKYAQTVASNPGVARPAGGSLTEIKRPGDAAWVPTSDMSKAGSILRVALPAGATGDAKPVTP